MRGPPRSQVSCQGGACPHPAALRPLRICGEGHPGVGSLSGRVFNAALLVHRNRKPHADERLPQQTFLFPISKRKIANLLQLDQADVSICRVSCSERKRFTLCRGERASLKRVRAAGPETRLTGHSAKLLTQDTHCLPCQLPEDLLSHSFPSELGRGKGSKRGRRGQGLAGSGKLIFRTEGIRSRVNDHPGLSAVLGNRTIKFSQSPATALHPGDSVQDNVLRGLITERAQERGQLDTAGQSTVTRHPRLLPGFALSH